MIQVIGDPLPPQPMVMGQSFISTVMFYPPIPMTPARTIECPDCKGRGQTNEYGGTDGFTVWIYQKSCPLCKGKGRVKLVPVEGLA